LSAENLDVQCFQLFSQVFPHQKSTVDMELEKKMRQTETAFGTFVEVFPFFSWFFDGIQFGIKRNLFMQRRYTLK
jgi:hypothetical protein